MSTTVVSIVATYAKIPVGSLSVVIETVMYGAVVVELSAYRRPGRSRYEVRGSISDNRGLLGIKSAKIDRSWFGDDVTKEELLGEILDELSIDEIDDGGPWEGARLGEVMWDSAGAEGVFLR